MTANLTPGSEQRRPADVVDLFLEVAATAVREHLHAEFPSAAPVVALWSPWTSCLNVVEGSHLEPRETTSVLGVDYEFGDSQLLWLNLDTQFQVPTGGLTSPLTVLLPYRSEATRP